MIEFVIFTGVFLFYYAVEVCIEYFIFGNAKGKNGSSIQTEQRKLLEAHAILKEVTLKAVAPLTEQQHNHTTTSQNKQEKIYNTGSYNTSLVVYTPVVEETSSFPLVYLGSIFALFVLVFVISKWISKTDKKQKKTSSSDKSIKQDDNTRTLKECVEESAESSDLWFDACQECSNVTEPDDVFEEWFDACQECSNSCVDDEFEEWFDASAELFEDCVQELERSRIVDEAGVFVVSDDVSSAEDSEDVLIAFGDFSLDQTKQFMETTGFVLTMSNQKEIEKKVEEREEESEKQEKVEEAGINTFRTDLQISQSTNTAPRPLDRELQKWEPAEDDDEADELQSLEKEGQDLKDQTILSAEEMYKLNPDVQSTFLEDLSQYTTKLDTSSLSREQIEFAEKMANEIMKENKQRKNKQRRKNNKHRNRNY